MGVKDARLAPHLASGRGWGRGLVASPSSLVAGKHLEGEMAAHAALDGEGEPELQ